MSLYVIRHRQNLIELFCNLRYYSAAFSESLCSGLLPKDVKINIYRTINMPVVLYVCETWSMTLKEECRLRVFENRMMSRIFGPKKDEVTGEWRKLHNKELYAVYPSPNIIPVIKPRRLRSAGHVTRTGERCI